VISLIRAVALLAPFRLTIPRAAKSLAQKPLVANNAQAIGRGLDIASEVHATRDRGIAEQLHALLRRETAVRDATIGKTAVDIDRHVELLSS